MKTLRNVVLLATLGAAGACAGAAAPASAPAPAGGVSSAETMLANVLPAVVTVAVRAEDAYAPRVFGFGEEEPAAVARRAYGGALDLSDFDGSGSGFVLARGGSRYVVTNAHVVEFADPDEIYIFSVDRRRYHMRLVGGDTFRDMAVLAFRDAPGPELSTVDIHAAGDLRVGMPVWAVGNPLGRFPYSVTSGVVSGLNRTLAGLITKVGYLQTDAPVTFGNSGGPLVGAGGTVVGLITAGLDETDINFALEGRHLSRLVDDVIRTGHVVRAFTGLIVEGDPLGGLTIVDALPGSPAAGQARLTGAELTAIDGESVEVIEDAIGILEAVAPGTEVGLTLGDGSEARIRTAELTDEWLTEIGRRAAETFDLTLAEGEDGVTVAVGMRELPDGVWTAYERLPTAGDRLVLAGFASGWAEEVWQINALKDLGVVSRLSLPAGALVLVFEGPDGAEVVVGTELAPTGIF